MMPEHDRDVTLGAVHDTLTAGFGEMRAGFADLKTTLIAGFAGLPTRESSEEMLRVMRESHRLQEERLAQLDVRNREQHLATQRVLHSLAESHDRLAAEQRRLSRDIRALIARLDAIIRGRDNGGPAGGPSA